MFTTKEIASLVQLPWGTLIQYIRLGHVHPAVRGSKRESKPHIFSPQQSIGLAVAAALAQSRQGCSPAYVGMIVSAYGKMDETTFEDTYLSTVRREPDPYAEESRAKWQADEIKPFCPLPIPNGVPTPNALTEEQQRVVADAMRRENRVIAEIRRRRAADQRVEKSQKVSK